ncbi:MAG: hypothetical protein KatS3mg103_0364 [Phycisphaerales bacterium]|nr:MAG: hypothetical protein KatS3mg103_0364 [Phycisphaerales bacterium]
MSLEAVIVLGVVALVLVALAFTRIAADAILVSALALLLVVPVPTDAGLRLGVLSPKQAIGGFGSTALAVVAVLFVVVTGLRETGAIDWISSRVLGRPKTLRGAMLRLMAPVAGMSAFLNNTPVVALMIPAVSDWCKRTARPPSKLMIPLSYAAILGGTCSLIGTSTNLVVAGMVIDQTTLDPLGMFDITWVGLPCVLVGLAFLLLLGPRLLPSRGSLASAIGDPREYTLEMMVPQGSPLAGRSVEHAGLRNPPGLLPRGDRTRRGHPLGRAEHRAGPGRSPGLCRHRRGHQGPADAPGPDAGDRPGLQARLAQVPTTPVRGGGLAHQPGDRPHHPPGALPQHLQRRGHRRGARGANG